MGLGAGFKLKDKDKDKHRDKDKARENHERTPSKTKHREKFREKMEENEMLPLLHLEPAPSFEFDTPDSHNATGSDTLNVPTNNGVHHAINSGWSGVLESWFCHGGHNPNDLHPKSPISLKSVVHHPKDYLASRPHLSPRISSRSLNEMSLILPRAPGPYEMLIKERLMGIYLVVFVHRDVKPLVRGSYLTAPFGSTTNDYLRH